MKHEPQESKVDAAFLVHNSDFRWMCKRIGYNIYPCT